MDKKNTAIDQSCLHNTINDSAQSTKNSHTKQDIQTTFVLVHGAWHGGWCWDKFSPVLRAAGYTVFTPTLTGLGERSHLRNTNVDLNMHVKDIVNMLEYSDLKNVTLVGHSYAGMVITGVAEVIPLRISHLIYMDAYVPENGKSVNDYNSTQALSSGLKRTNRIPVCCTMEEFGVTEVEDVKWMESRIGDQPYKSFAQSLKVKPGAVTEIRKTFIQLSELPQFLEAAERVKDTEFTILKMLIGGHDAMITKPNELGEMVLSLVNN